VLTVISVTFPETPTRSTKVIAYCKHYGLFLLPKAILMFQNIYRLIHLPYEIFVFGLGKFQVTEIGKELCRVVVYLFVLGIERFL
jgi:hypothetical protein